MIIEPTIKRELVYAKGTWDSEKTKKEKFSEW